MCSWHHITGLVVFSFVRGLLLSVPRSPHGPVAHFFHLPSGVASGQFEAAPIAGTMYHSRSPTLLQYILEQILTDVSNVSQVSWWPELWDIWLAIPPYSTVHTEHDKKSERSVVLYACDAVRVD